MDHAGQDVAAELVLAEPVLGAGRRQVLGEHLRARIVRREPVGARGDHEQRRDEHGAEHEPERRARHGRARAAEAPIRGSSQPFTTSASAFASTNVAAIDRMQPWTTG